MNRVFLNLGFIKIYYYSLFIFMGVLVGGFLVYKELKKNNFDIDKFIDLVFNIVIFSLIGARVYYVLFNFSYYFRNPLEIISIWNGGLAIHGGIIGGFLYLIYFCKKNKINILKLLDIIVIGLIVGQSIGRWGNFFNSEAYGSVTTYSNLSSLLIPKFIIDGMYIDGNYYHPTFLYESCLNILGFVILIMVRKYFKKLKVGQLTGIYLVWYSIIRFIIEAMRLDSLMLGSLKIAQVVSFILFVVGSYLIFINSRKVGLYNEEDIYE